MKDYSPELARRMVKLQDLARGSDRGKYEREFSLFVRDFQKEQEAQEQEAAPPAPEPKLDADLAEGYDLYQRWGVD